MAKCWGHIEQDWANANPEKHRTLRERAHTIYYNSHFFEYTSPFNRLKTEFNQGEISEEDCAKQYAVLLEKALEETTPENVEILKVLYA